MNTELKLGLDVYSKIMKQASEDISKECGGFLLGDISKVGANIVGTVTEYLPINRVGTTSRFKFSAPDITEAFIFARANNLRIIGTSHSHGMHNAFISDVDEIFLNSRQSTEFMFVWSPSERSGVCIYKDADFRKYDSNVSVEVGRIYSAENPFRSKYQFAVSKQASKSIKDYIQRAPDKMGVGLLIGIKNENGFMVNDISTQGIYSANQQVLEQNLARIEDKKRSLESTGQDVLGTFISSGNEILTEIMLNKSIYNRFTNNGQLVLALSPIEQKEAVIVKESYGNWTRANIIQSDFPLVQRQRQINRI